MKLDRVTAVLFDAEKSLAAIASEAVQAGEYERAKSILELATQLSAMARLGELSRDSGSGGERGTSGSQPNQPHPSRKIKGKRAAYPSFYREGDALLKIGYSKRSGEYEHKAPSNIVFTMADAIARVSEKNRRFTMDDLLPLVAGASGNSVPVYQPYVCLSWLRELGLVVQHGRKGYSTKVASELVKLVRAHWEQMAARSNSLN